MSRTQTYIAFDGDADLMSYRTIQGWNQDRQNPFRINDAHEINNARDDSLPDSIKAQLQERLDLSKHLVLIIGSETNQNRKGILQYEINYALRNDLPIILVFKGYSTNDDNNNTLWENKLLPKIPKVLRDAEEKYCVICPFSREMIQGAIEVYSEDNLPDKGYAWYWEQ